MGSYIYPEIDFVYRTQQLLKQYKQIEKNSLKIKNYNITLFLNCFVGLLIIPQQKAFNSISNSELVGGIDIHGINPDNIFAIKNHQLVDEVKSFRNIAKHMRNSIAHNHFTTICHNNNIESIEFKDYKGKKDEKNPEKGLTFNFTITIKNLELFIEMISSNYLNEMAAKKGYNDFEDFKKKDKNGKDYRDIDTIFINNKHKNAP